MTGGLPRGLISLANASEAPETGRERDEDFITKTQDIGRSWKIYSASSNVLGQDVGERLENLFWRLWSNPRLVHITDAEKITRLVVSISQGEGRVQRSRAIQALSAGDHDVTPTSQSPEATTSARVKKTPALSEKAAAHLSDETSTNLTSRKISITKLSGLGSDVSQASTSHQNREQDTVQNLAESSGSATETFSPTSRPLLRSRTSSSSKKRTTFVAATRAKTRPSVVRRKSSQGTPSQSNEQVKSPKLPARIPSNSQSEHQNQKLSTERPMGLAPPPGIPAIPSAAGAPSFLLPSASSWQSVESGTSPHTSNISSSSQGPSLLVDRDFRGKFVEQQKRAASQTNLVAASDRLKKSGSVVRFADEKPDDVQRRRQDSLRMSSRRGENVWLSDDANESNEHDLCERRDSEVIVDEDDAAEEDEEEMPALPRVRSQLSMMIDHRRRVSGSLDLDSSAIETDDKGKGKAQEEESKSSKEDELLMMGRRDGFTKAGGVTRSRSSKISSSAQFRYRSPPPPPLFG